MAIKRGGIASKAQYSERGIVLHTIKYSERQLIIHLLTRSHGRMSYMTNIARGFSLHTASRNIFQPLFVLEFQANATTGTMHRLSQCEPSPQLNNIPLEIVKSSIAIFISELLYRIVREPVDDSQMYDFVEDSIMAFDTMEHGVANFHIWFLVHLAYYMGYGLPQNYQSKSWFDIKHGEFTRIRPLHPLRIAPEYAEVLHRFNQMSIGELDSVKLSRDARRPLLEALVDYYSYHCDTISSVRSIEMLAELF